MSPAQSRIQFEQATYNDATADATSGHSLACLLLNLSHSLALSLDSAPTLVWLVDVY